LRTPKGTHFILIEEGRKKGRDCIFETSSDGFVASAGLKGAPLTSEKKEKGEKSWRVH